MQPFSLLLSVATGIRTMMYCKNDGLRDYQQEMKLRLFKEWEFHRSVMVQNAWAQPLFMVYLKTKKRTDVSQIQAGFKAF